MRIALFVFALALPLAAQINSFRYTFGNKFANFSDFTDPTTPDPEKNQCSTTDEFWGNPACKAVDVRTELAPTVQNLVQAPVFAGKGLNDIAVSGTSNDTASSLVVYEVEIDAAGTPDTFKWRRVGRGAYTTGVPITAAAQTLAPYGIVVTFAHTTGHTLGAKWKITTRPPLYRAEPSCPRWRLDNADGSMYLVGANTQNSSVFIRSSDNSVVEMAPIALSETNEPRWDAADPDQLYYRNGCRFFSYRVSRRSSTLVHDFANDFPGCTKIFNDTEGDSSPDSRYWAFMVLGPYLHGNSALQAVVVYDKQNNAISGTMDRARYVEQGGNPDVWDTFGYRPNMVDIAPSGDRVLLLWPAVDYPVTHVVYVMADPVTVAEESRMTLNGQDVMTRWFAPGDTAKMTCSGALASATGFRKVLFVSQHSLDVDVAGLGLSNGTYPKGTCTYAGRNAILNLQVSGGIATATAGNNHRLESTTRTIQLYGIPGIADSTSVSVAGTLNPRQFTFRTTLADGAYTNQAMYWRDTRHGVHIKDDDFSFPELKPNNDVGNDGAHVYHLDFSSPLKVANGQPHSGWAWDLNGDPMLLWYCNNNNWKKGKPDFFSATNVYTGEVIPVFSHQDMNFESTSDHYPRVYDRKVRGWGIAGFASYGNAKNKLRNQIIAFELKPYTEHPEIWRIGSLHNVLIPRHGGFRDDGYWMEAPIQPNGAFTRLYWGAYWQGSNPGGAAENIWVNTYYLDLPLRLRTRGSVQVDRAAEGARFSYIASTTDPCSITLSGRPDLSQPIELKHPDRGGDQHRTFIAPSALPQVQYFYKIDCGLDTMTGSFTLPAGPPPSTPQTRGRAPAK